MNKSITEVKQEILDLVDQGLPYRDIARKGVHSKWKEETVQYFSDLQIGETVDKFNNLYNN